MRRFLLCLLANMWLFSAMAQDVRQQRLTLEMGAVYLIAVHENQINLDSCLILTAKSFGISPYTVVTEGFEASWMQTESPAVAAKRLPTLQGIDKIRLLLQLGAYYTFRTGTNDSALLYLQAANKESERLHADKWKYHTLCVLGKYYLENNEIEKGADCFNQVLKSGDKELEAKANNYYGTYLPFTIANMPDKIGHMKKAMTLYHELKDTCNEVLMLNYVGLLDFVVQQPAEAMAAMEQSLPLQEKIRFPYLHYTYDHMAMLSAYQSNFPKELKYALMALKSVESTGDYLAAAYIYTRVGDMNGWQEKNKEAMEWYMKSLQLFEKQGGDPVMYRLVNNIGMILSREGKVGEEIKLMQRLLKQYPTQNPIYKQDVIVTLANAYAALKNNVLAEQYYLEALDLEKQTVLIRGDIGTAQAITYVAMFYINTKQFSKARPYFDRLTSPRMLNFLQKATVANIRKCQFSIDSAMGNYKGAIQHLLAYDSISATIYSATESKQVENLRIQYQSSEKEKDNELLRAQSQLQKNKIHTANIITRITISGVVMLLLIIGLILRQYIIKQKSSKLLEQQKNEIDSQNVLLQEILGEKDELLTSREWLLKEIHHRVKNNLQIMISLLNVQSASLSSNEAIAAIRESQSRMHAMSLIHQKLYQSENLSEINMQTYIGEFIRYLQTMFSNGNRVKVTLDIAPVKLDVTQAVPLGLILNEAVSNAYKYAFADNDNPQLSISVHADEVITVLIKDNGKGFKENSFSEDNNTLGFNLMKGLTEQLEGHFSFTNNNGITISIIFKPNLKLMQV